MAGNKRQAIKARVHANVYPRQNNNNSGANPPFGPPSCAGRKAAKKWEGGVRDAGERRDFKKGEKERKEKGESSPSDVERARRSLTCARVCVALSSIRVRFAVRVQYVLSTSASEDERA